MRPYCQCEYCVQDRARRAESRPVMAADVVWLGVAIALAIASCAGFLAAWWVQ